MYCFVELEWGCWRFPPPWLIMVWSWYQQRLSFEQPWLLAARGCRTAGHHGDQSLTHSLNKTTTSGWFPGCRKKPSLFPALEQLTEWRRVLHPWLLKVSVYPEFDHIQRLKQYWLVVGPPLWKIWKSIGMMTFPIYGKIKLMFQTTNQNNKPPMTGLCADQKQDPRDTHVQEVRPCAVFVDLRADDHGCHDLHGRKKKTRRTTSGQTVTKTTKTRAITMTITYIITTKK